MYAKDQRIPTAAINCFKILDENKVSAHYSIDRKGSIWQHVDTSKRAWHAGESTLPPSKKFPKGRSNINDFSVGIEMIGVWGQRFRAKQYRSLIRLLIQLCGEFSIERIVSHQLIAPERKQDPGPSFNWDILKRECCKNRLSINIIP